MLFPVYFEHYPNNSSRHISHMVPTAGAFLCGVCMFFLCLCVFSPGGQVSSPWSKRAGLFGKSKFPMNECEWLCVCIMDWWPVHWVYSASHPVSAGIGPSSGIISIGNECLAHFASFCQSVSSLWYSFCCLSQSISSFVSLWILGTEHSWVLMLAKGDPLRRRSMSALWITCVHYNILSLTLIKLLDWMNVFLTCMVSQRWFIPGRKNYPTRRLSSAWVCLTYAVSFLCPPYHVKLFAPFCPGVYSLGDVWGLTSRTASCQCWEKLTWNTLTVIPLFSRGDDNVCVYAFIHGFVCAYLFEKVCFAWCPDGPSWLCFRDKNINHSYSILLFLFICQ